MADESAHRYGELSIQTTWAAYGSGAQILKSLIPLIQPKGVRLTVGSLDAQASGRRFVIPLLVAGDSPPSDGLIFYPSESRGGNQGLLGDVQQRMVLETIRWDQWLR